VARRPRATRRRGSTWFARRWVAERHDPVQPDPVPPGVRPSVGRRRVPAGEQTTGGDQATGRQAGGPVATGRQAGGPVAAGPVGGAVRPGRRGPRRVARTDPPARFLATVHPSSVLRADDRQTAFAEFVADLAVLARALAGHPG